MCGIIAVSLGHDDAISTVLETLGKLRYRGYDSWGVGIPNSVYKSTGSIVFDPDPELKDAWRSSVALGHTRWATVGDPGEKSNAHPIETDHFLVVHNGTIQNLDQLKEVFDYGTVDTHVFASMLETGLKNGKSTQVCVEQAFKKVKGPNAFVVFDKIERRIYAIKRKVPLYYYLALPNSAFCSDYNAL